jgi:hypothetical protein
MPFQTALLSLICTTGDVLSLFSFYQHIGSFPGGIVHPHRRWRFLLPHGDQAEARPTAYWGATSRALPSAIGRWRHIISTGRQSCAAGAASSPAAAVQGHGPNDGAPFAPAPSAPPDGGRALVLQPGRALQLPARRHRARLHHHAVHQGAHHLVCPPPPFLHAGSAGARI